MEINIHEKALYVDDEEKRLEKKVFSIISGKIFADNLIDFSYIVCWDWNFSPRAKHRRTA